jgi:transposase
MLRDPRRRALLELRRRLKIVKDYLDGRRAGMSEADAADRSATRFQVGISTVRRWARCFRAGGATALMPACGQPSDAQLAAHYKSTISFAVISVILAIRAHLGWCGQRIAEELERRGIARIGHTSVYRVLSRYHVPVRTYHPVGRSAGIQYRKQRVLAPNRIWHIDFAGPWSDTDGVPYSILIVIDAFSRMLLALECVWSTKAARTWNRSSNNSLSSMASPW